MTLIEQSHMIGFKKKQMEFYHENYIINKYIIKKIIIIII